MPRRSATRRASATSASEQHPESDSPPHSFKVAPTTSWPSSSRRAAATEESTPPDMATSTRTGSVSQAPGAQLRDGTGNGLEGVVDLLGPTGGAEAEAQCAACLARREADGREHVALLVRPARARRADRGGDAPGVEGEEELLALDPLDEERAGARYPQAPRDARTQAGDGGHEAVLEAVTQRTDARRRLGSTGGGRLRRGGHGDGAGDVLRPGAQGRFLAAAEEQRAQGRSRASRRDEGPDPLRPAELVRRQAHEVAPSQHGGQVEPGERLDGVGVHEGLRSELAHERDDLGDRLDGAEL